MVREAWPLRNTANTTPLTKRDRVRDACPNHIQREQTHWIETEDGHFVKVCYECYLELRGDERTR